jgi:hypothetical protein
MAAAIFEAKSTASDLVCGLSFQFPEMKGLRAARDVVEAVVDAGLPRKVGAKAVALEIKAATERARNFITIEYGSRVAKASGMNLTKGKTEKAIQREGSLRWGRSRSGEMRSKSEVESPVIGGEKTACEWTIPVKFPHASQETTKYKIPF